MNNVISKFFVSKTKDLKQVNSIVSTNADRHIRKIHFFGILAIIVIISLVFTFLLQYYNRELSNVCTSKNNIYILEQAGPAIQSDNIVKLNQLRGKIKSLPNYQKDPNCLYVVVNSYIREDNPNNASLYLTKLEKVYNPKKGYNKYLAPTKSLAVLRGDITAVEVNIKLAQKNAIGFPHDHGN